MAHNWYDKSPMWPQFNHGCPEPVPPDAEPYNTPYAVLGKTEAGEYVFTIHTIDGETYDVEAGNNIIVLKDTTYKLSSDDEHIILTSSDGDVQSIPVFESAEATTEKAGFMSVEDKAKLDGIEANAQRNPTAATTTKMGLMSAADKQKLDGIETGAQKNVDISNATTTTAGLMSASDKEKLDGLSQVSYGLATTTTSGLMSSEDKQKLDNVPDEFQTYEIATTTRDGLMSRYDVEKLDTIDRDADVNTIEGIKLNGTLLEPDEDRIVSITVASDGSGGSIDLSNYPTKTEMNTAIATAIGNAMSASY